MKIVSEIVKDRIKDSVDVETLLRVLGFKVTKTSEFEIRASCAIHQGDNPTAFSIRLDNKKWRCFTKKCEQDGFGNVDNDLIALVRRITGRNFIDSIKFLAELSGIPWDDDSFFTDNNNKSINSAKENKSFIRSVSRINRPPLNNSSISEDIVLDCLSKRDSYFVNLGFREETLDFFQVGSMVDRRGISRATIPIRDSKGELVGISARRTDCDEDPRYLLEYEFEKGRVLYNINNATFSSSGAVIIVEGFKALWAVFEAGYINVVACMGAALSQDQFLLLCNSGFTRCFVLFDGDSAGKTGASKAYQKLSNAFNTEIIELPDGVSPDDLDRSELKCLLDFYTSCV